VKSGQRRSTPLLYATDGDRIVLVASKAGAAKHPAWDHNLKANPKVDVLASGRSGAYVAAEAQGEERTRLWEEVNDLYAGRAREFVAASHLRPVAARWLRDVHPLAHLADRDV
jgi:deazaflavin-dependent oxidoreductase (nitroreductase family)